MQESGVSNIKYQIRKFGGKLARQPGCMEVQTYYQGPKPWRLSGTTRILVRGEHPMKKLHYFSTTIFSIVEMEKFPMFPMGRLWDHCFSDSFIDSSFYVCCSFFLPLVRTTPLIFLYPVNYQRFSLSSFLFYFFCSLYENTLLHVYTVTLLFTLLIVATRPS